MFDKMQISVKIALENIMPLVALNKLEKCTSGERVFYRLPEKVANFTGLWFEIANQTATLKFCLHKQYNVKQLGKLDNSNGFSMAQAKRFIIPFLENIGINPQQCNVKYYEIGLNIPLSESPLLFIQEIKAVGTGKKETFVDANYKKDRQRTTEKTTNVKKVFKIYDKGFESYSRKGIKPDKGEDYPHILRIETIYKRQNKPLCNLFTPTNLKKLASQFYKDWKNAEFAKRIETAKGVTTAQLTRAKQIIDLGIETYIEKNKADYKNGAISPKTYRNNREFAEQWQTINYKFRVLPTRFECEFLKNFQTFMKIAQNVD